MPRTLLDLSAVLSRDELRSAIERYPRRPGIRAARAVAEEAQRGLGVVRSELEERFQTLLLNAGLPGPSTNCIIEGYEVDCAWPGRRLVVELDGRRTHGVVHAFEADRERDRVLGVAGWRVVRITWRQLHDTPHDIARDLRALLRG